MLYPKTAHNMQRWYASPSLFIVSPTSKWINWYWWTLHSCI